MVMLPQSARHLYIAEPAFQETRDRKHTAGHAKDVGYKLLQLLSEVFDEPVDKRNLKSVLKRQSNIKIALNSSNNIDGNSNIINYITACSDIPTPTPNKSQPATPDNHDGADRVKIETIGKLRQLGLSEG
jgi:hypothetical protein